MPKIFMICVILLTIAMPSRVSAHSGRTNASGCHEDRSTGIRHCHEEVEADDEESAQDEPEPSRQKAEPVFIGPPIPPSDVLAAMRAHHLPVRAPGDGFEVVPASRVQMIHLAQTLLRALGAEIQDAPGELRESTILAIRAFQRQQEMRADGRVSGNLLLRLAEAVAARCSPP